VVKVSSLGDVVLIVVDPDDPIAVAKQRDRHALINEYVYLELDTTDVQVGRDSATRDRSCTSWDTPCPTCSTCPIGSEKGYPAWIRKEPIRVRPLLDG
jgi:hypothetical protein